MFSRVKFEFVLSCIAQTHSRTPAILMRHFHRPQVRHQLEDFMIVGDKSDNILVTTVYNPHCTLYVVYVSNILTFSQRDRPVETNSNYKQHLV